MPVAKTVEATAVNTPKADINFGPVAATDIFGTTVTNDAPDTFPIGDTIVTWTATDGNKLTNTVKQVITIVDTTVPVFTEKPVAKTVEATAVETPKSDIDFGTVAATDIFGVTVTNDAPTTFPLGPTTVTWTATDGNKLISTASQVITVVDTTKPVFTFVPSSKTVFATGVTTQVDIGLATAYDIFGTTITNDAPAVFPVGSTTITWTATDGNGLIRTATQVITVKYNFTGFFQPIDMGGVTNSVKAGSSIPVKFSLGGDMGLNVLSSIPLATALILDPTTKVEDIEIVTFSNSGLTYDPLSKQYTYVWKTDKNWVGLSKKLIVKFADGSECTANFKFK